MTTTPQSEHCKTIFQTVFGMVDMAGATLVGKDTNVLVKNCLFRPDV
jgi:hypothetical protein